MSRWGWADGGGEMGVSIEGRGDKSEGTRECLEGRGLMGVGRWECLDGSGPMGVGR